MMVLIRSCIIGILHCARHDMMAEREVIFIREGLQRQFSWRYSNRLSLLNSVTGMPFYDA
jgi:hypothetical protein